MANFFKVKALMTVMAGFEEEYDKLYNCEDLTEYFNLDEDFGWIDDEDEHYFIPEKKQLCINFVLREFEMDIDYVRNFLSELFEEKWNMEFVFCDEFEDTTSVGYCITDDSYDFEKKAIVRGKHEEIKPENDWQRHEMFELAWNGWHAPGASGFWFFDQLGLSGNYKGQPLSPFLTSFMQRMSICVFNVPATSSLYEDGEMKDAKHGFIRIDISYPITKQSLAKSIIDEIDFDDWFLEEYKDYDVVSFDVSHFNLADNLQLIYDGYYRWSDGEPVENSDIHYEHRKR